MKKMIVSMMLIISMFAFAAESDPSNTVGYVRYDLLQPSTGYNMIALPVDQGYSVSSSVGDAIANCNQVSQYDATSQAWVASGLGMFGWTNTFPVQAGKGLQVNVTAPSTFINSGEVVDIPAYNLLVPSTGYNVIMHPLTHGSMTTSGALGDDIPNCNQVSQYDASSQAWVASGLGMFGWTNTFPTEMGKGLQVNVTAGSTWPSSKSYDMVEGDVPELPKGGNKNVFYACVDHNGDAFDFTAAPYDDVRFKAWITARPGEVQQEISGGTGYEMLGPYSAVFINVANFATPWSAGDQVEFLVRVVDPGTLENLYEGSGVTGPLDGAADDSYWGVEAFIPGSGDAISVSEPSTVESNLPSVTRLHQNYPNPFNPTTTIRFELASDSNVRLNVYNYNGQLVRSLVNGPMSIGYHSVNFDAASLSAGVYYYTMEAAGRTMTQKMVLVK